MILQIIYDIPKFYLDLYCVTSRRYMAEKLPIRRKTLYIFCVTKSSAKMLKLSIIHTFTSESCSQRATEECEVIRLL